MTILDILADHARERVREENRLISLEELRERAMIVDSDGRRFYDAIRREGVSFICEVKKASPSKGIIDPVFDYLTIADDYEKGGADAISCLTETKWFLGSDEIFRQIRQRVSIPMLRKDFIIDEYQIYQSKLLGADCVLLICTLLDQPTIDRWLRLCDDLKLAVLVEAHDERELEMALETEARMIGVNNRNLKDFSVDLDNARRLRERIPADRLFVAESGISGPQDIRKLREVGVDAVLIGESLMRAADRKGFLKEMKEAGR